MGEDGLELTVPTPRLEAAYMAFIDEFAAAGEESHKDERAGIERAGGFGGYVSRLHELAKGLNLGEDEVPCNHYWLVRDGEVLGSIRLRHELDAHQDNEDGHIGYDVRPSARGKGYATLMLKLVLRKARALGLERVLVTCNADNPASARVIEKNGGVWEDTRAAGQTGRVVRRYWIDLSGQPSDALGREPRSR